VFDYPGRYLKKSPGDALTKLRIEYEEAAYQETAGEGACLGFTAGTYFSLSSADPRETGKEYLVSSVEHSAEDWSQLARRW
jgi:type VI secretion system secreted protein VgrG